MAPKGSQREGAAPCARVGVTGGIRSPVGQKPRRADSGAIGRVHLASRSGNLLHVSSAHAGHGDRAGGSYDRLVDRPQPEIDGCQTAHQRLRAIVGDLGDADFGQPSQLPGWSVGHVLTHLARNAEAMCRRIEGAMRSEILEQYAGGPAGRLAEIESGSKRPSAEIREDVIEWSIRLDALFRSIPEDVWVRPVRTVAGSEHPVALLPFRRWREVEVHLVDLGGDASPADWPDSLVDRALPGLVAGLTDRADQRELMAWLLGRGPAPELRPWG
jgi:maleylpyruvate isomerase